jgi:hypothetical protein
VDVPKPTHYYYCHLVLRTLWKAPIEVRTRESGQENGKGGEMRGVQRGEHEELAKDDGKVRLIKAADSG